MTHWVSSARLWSLASSSSADLYAPQQVAGWDQDLPRDEKQRWASWFGTLLTSQEAVFPRATRPLRAVGKTKNGRILRQLGSCHVRCSIRGVGNRGCWHKSSQLLLAKCRVAPLLGMTIPRGELLSSDHPDPILACRCRGIPSTFRSPSLRSRTPCAPWGPSTRCPPR